MLGEMDTTAALWWAVVISGIYHGVNPGMGWPLGVSAALMEGNRLSALFKAIVALAIGHFLSMFVMLLPFSLMLTLIYWQSEIQLGAASIIIVVGLYLFIRNRHPRMLARIHPARLGLWSFLAAMAHGAGLMLVPIYLGICRIAEDDTGHLAARELIGQNLMTALTVAGVHSAAMITAGGVLALVIYLWLGLRFLSRTWFNLDRVWALSLVLVGCFGAYQGMYMHS